MNNNDDILGYRINERLKNILVINIFCADNVTHIKISNKLTPSINYFYSNRTYTVNF